MTTLIVLYLQLGLFMANGFHFEVTKLTDNQEFVDSCALLVCEVDAEKHHDVENIESLTLFKHSTRLTKEVIATVSPFEPTMNKACHANAITANYTAHHAEIKLVVKDEIECQTGMFSCEVKYLSVDGHGKISNLFKHLEDYEPLELTEIAENLDKKLEALSQKMSTCLDKQVAEKEVTCDAPSGNSPREIIKAEEGFSFLCDTLTDGGGWTIIQRRINGDVDFNRTWADYKMGFGSLEGDFWLGNDKIHLLTSKKPHELRVDLFYNFKHYYAYYSNISVDNEENKYTLELGDYSGTAGDSLTATRNHQKFSTYDEDNDSSYEKCAVTFGSGWWFNDCHYSNLNGKWGVSDTYNCLRWNRLAETTSMWSCEMKIRSKK